jgi:hypothetical protein
MNTIQRSYEAGEIQGFTGYTNGVAVLDRQFHGQPDSNMMKNLHAIVSLSLLFFERIVKPFDGPRDTQDVYGLD